MQTTFRNLGALLSLWCSLFFRSLLGRKSHNSRAQSAGFRWRVSPVSNKCCSLKYRAHHLTLHTYTLTVNYSNAAKTLLMGQHQVFLDDPFHVTWRDRVEIENIRDHDLNRFRKRIVWIKVR